MSKTQNVTAKDSIAAEKIATTKTTVAAEQPKAKEKTKVDAPAEPKVTPVEERTYRLINQTEEPLKFRGKQRQIVYDVLRASGTQAHTIAEISKVAAKAGLTAVGGVEPSVRYHLHQMVTDGTVEVTNPTIEIK